MRLFKQVSVASGKCLDVLGMSPTDNGATVDIYDCQDDADDETWYFEFENTMRYFRVKNRATGKCLDIEGSSSTANGARGQQWDCDSFTVADSDQWWEAVVINPHTLN